jgi:hypothetical protein
VSDNLKFKVSWSEDVYNLICEGLPHVDVYGTIRRFVPMNTKMILDHDFLEFSKTETLVHKYLDFNYVWKGLKYMAVKESIDVEKLPYLPARQNLQAAYIGLKKNMWDYKNPVKDLENWDKSLEWMNREFLPIISGYRVRKLKKVCDDSDLTKSNGPCYNFRWKSKADMLADIEGRNIINQYWKEAAYPGKCFTLFGCNLKDELRNYSKIESNSTRLFWSAPATHHFLGARLLHDFNERLIKFRNLSCHTLGLNRFSPEWNKVMSQFLGRKVLDSDASKWDTRFFPEALWDVAQTVWSAMDERDKTIDNLYRFVNYIGTTVESVGIMPDGTIFGVFGGMPSGVFITASFNTMQHFRQHAYMWLCLVCSDQTVENFNNFKREYLLLLQGDDDLASPSDQIIVTYDLSYRKIIDFMDQFMEHTSSHDGYVSILDAIYCSQRNVMIGNTIFPVPDPYRTVSSLLIGGKKEDIAIKFSRTCAIRIHSYFDEDLKNICERYYWFLLTKYTGTLSVTDIELIKSYFLSHSAIWRLYTSWESKGCEFLNDTAALNTMSENVIVSLPQRQKRRRNNSTKEVSNLAAIKKEAVPAEVKESRAVQSVTDSNAAKAGTVVGNGRRKNKNRNRIRNVSTARKFVASESVNTQAMLKAGMGSMKSREYSKNTPGSLSFRQKFLKQMVDPGNVLDLVGYPDSFIGKSSVFKSKITCLIPGWEGAYGTNFPAGGFMALIRQTFPCPVMVLSEITPADEYGTANAIYNLSITQQTLNGAIGLRDITSTFDSSAEVAASMVVNVGETYNIVGVMTTPNLEPTPSIFPFANIAADSTPFYGFSMVVDNGVSINIMHDYANSTPTVGQLFVDCITTTLTTRTFITLTANTIATATLTLPGVSTPPHDYNGDAMIGFRVGLLATPTSGPGVSELNFVSVRVQCSLDEDSTMLTWVPETVPNAPEISKTYQRYRVVAQSSWSQCIYPVLGTGGVIAGKVFDGIPFMQQGDNDQGYPWNFPGITNADGSYSGPLLNGVYSFNFPATSGDNSLRPLGAVDFLLTPHTCHLGSLSGTNDGSNVIRLSVETVYEMTTPFTFVMQVPSPVDARVLAFVKKAIESGNFPTSMENSLHEWLIGALTGTANFMEQATPQIKRIMNSGGPLLSELVGIGKALASVV